MFEFSGLRREYQVPQDVTQSGISRAVGIRVQHTSQYVRPLVDEGLLEEALCHVRGGVRRRKAYFLTPAGLTQASALRTDLLERPVALRGRQGSMRTIPLSQVLREGRRGQQLLPFVQELEARAYIDESTLLTPSAFIDLSGEAPAPERFYGREKELAELLQALERAPIVVVTGVAGIGKTALGSRVCEALRGTRSLYWRQIHPWDTPLDLAAGFATFLSAAGRTSLSDYLARAEAKLLVRFEQLLAVDFADLRSLVVLDDVHTASREAEGFLHCLKEALCKVRGATVLLLSRTAPGFYTRREVDTDGPVVELPLAGIDPRGVKEFLAQIPEADAPWVLKVAGGNPLFLRILARAGRTGGMERARYTIDRFIAEEMEAGLTDEERACLQLASLYEMPVPPSGLVLASPRGMTVTSRLLGKGLLDQTEEGRLIAHDFLRHHFQSALPPETRERLVEQAVIWLAEEAHRAEGERNVHGAIALLANAAMIDPSGARRGRTLEELGRLRGLAGDLPGAIDACRAALSFAGDPAGRARLHLQLSNALYPFHEDDEAEREVDRGLALLEPEPSLLGAWLRFVKGKLLFDKGAFDNAHENFEIALSWIPALPDDSELLGQLLEWKAVLLLYDRTRRNLALAESSYRASLQIRERIRSRWLTRSYEGLTLVALQSGRVADAFSYLDQAQRCYESQDYPPVSRNLEFLRAWALTECIGDYDTAESLYHVAADVAESAYERYRLVWFDRFFADLYSHEGRTEEAVDSMERFLRAARGAMTRENEIQNLSRMARLWAEIGDLPAARSCLNDAQRDATGRLSEPMKYYLEWANGALDTAEGDSAGARSRFRGILELEPPGRTGTNIQEHLASGTLRGEMLLDYARCLAAEGDRTGAETTVQEARDEFVSLGRAPLRERAERLLALPPGRNPS